MQFLAFSYSDLESRMKDELMNVKIKFTEQSARLAELKQEVSRLETKVCIIIQFLADILMTFRF